MIKPVADYQTLAFARQNRVATITLDRPDAANGLNLQMAIELLEVARLCDNDADLKAVILTANGRFFCAGGDVKGMFDAAAGEGAGIYISRLADTLHKAISIFARMDIPVINAVNGTAAGAGFSLAVTGDIVLAAESAKFTMSYTNVGLSPDGSSSYYLPRLIGVRKTQELMFTNRLLSAQEAVDWGLVTHVVPDDELLDEAQKYAQRFVTGAKGSFAGIKKLLLESFSNGLETQMEIEGRVIAQCADSPDGHEGVAAFVEKRQAKFK